MTAGHFYRPFCVVPLPCLVTRCDVIALGRVRRSRTNNCVNEVLFGIDVLIYLAGRCVMFAFDAARRWRPMLSLKHDLNHDDGASVAPLGLAHLAPVVSQLYSVLRSSQA